MPTWLAILIGWVVGSFFGVSAILGIVTGAARPAAKQAAA